MPQRLSIAMYHYTRDLAHSSYPRIKGLDRALFEQQLQFFSTHFSAVTMQDVIKAVYAKDGSFTLPENPLLLTFDDGFIDNFTVAFPLLKKYGMQGSFFIPGKAVSGRAVLDVHKIHFVLACAASAELVQDDIFALLDEARTQAAYRDIPRNELLYERYAAANANRFDDARIVFCKNILQSAVPEALRNEMTSRLFAKYVGRDEESFARELYMDYDQIRCLQQNGMFIGVHGYAHYALGASSTGQMQADIDKALLAMADFIDRDAWVMNYPYGSYSTELIGYIQPKGCVLGLTTDVGKADLGFGNRFTLQRLDCNDFPPKSDNWQQF